MPDKPRNRKPKRTDEERKEAGQTLYTFRLPDNTTFQTYRNSEREARQALARAVKNKRAYLKRVGEELARLNKMMGK